MFANKKGQSTLEYGLIIAVVVAALLAINWYMKKGVQGKLKESTDQIGRQFDPGTFSTAWRAQGNGTTTTVETRDTAANGATTSNITAAETITRGEYDDWGTKPGQHFQN